MSWSLCPAGSQRPSVCAQPSPRNSPQRARPLNHALDSRPSPATCEQAGTALAAGTFHRTHPAKLRGNPAARGSFPARSTRPAPCRPQAERGVQGNRHLPRSRPWMGPEPHSAPGEVLSKPVGPGRHVLKEEFWGSGVRSARLTAQQGGNIQSWAVAAGGEAAGTAWGNTSGVSG